MSNIDKKALREAAEKALQGEWDYEAGAIWNTDESGWVQHMASVDAGDDISDEEHKCNMQFITAATPAVVLELLDELEAKDKQIAELSSAVIAPGIMRCAGCGFVLTKNSINMVAGTITAGDSKTEPCPNGCGPLWPVTWKEQAIEMRDSSEQWFEELLAARQRIAELEARAVKPVAWMRNANVTSFMSRFTTDEKYAVEQWGDDAVALYPIPVAFIPVCFTDERNLMHINERGRETSLIWSKQNSDSGDIKLFRIAAAAGKGE